MSKKNLEDVVSPQAKHWLAKACEDYFQAKAKISYWEDKEKEAYEKIKDYLNHEVVKGRAGEYRISSYERDYKSLDKDKLKQQDPELYKMYKEAKDLVKSVEKDDKFTKVSTGLQVRITHKPRVE